MWWRIASGCLIQGIKLAMKNHISLSVNLYWIKIWSDLYIKSENWSYDLKYPKSQSPKSQCQSKIKCGNPHKVKKKKWSVKNQPCASSSWRKEFYIFYLEYRNTALSRGMSHGLPTKSQCSHSLKTQVRWVKYNGLIHSTSHQILEKPYIPVSKLRCLV